MDNYFNVCFEELKEKGFDGLYFFCDEAENFFVPSKYVSDVCFGSVTVGRKRKSNINSDGYVVISTEALNAVDKFTLSLAKKQYKDIESENLSLKSHIHKCKDKNGNDALAFNVDGFEVKKENTTLYTVHFENKPYYIPEMGDHDYSDCPSAEISGDNVKICFGKKSKTFHITSLEESEAAFDNFFGKELLRPFDLCGDMSAVKVSTFLNGRKEVVYKIILHFYSVKYKLTFYGIAINTYKKNFCLEDDYCEILRLSDSIMISFGGEFDDTYLLCSRVYSEEEYNKDYGKDGKPINDSRFLYENRRIDAFYHYIDDRDDCQKINVFLVDYTDKSFIVMKKTSDGILDSVYCNDELCYNSFSLPREMFDIFLHGLEKSDYKNKTNEEDI